MNQSPGRPKSATTINREIRRTLNGYAAQIAEKSLAKALSGDSQALMAVSALLISANQPVTK